MSSVNESAITLIHVGARSNISSLIIKVHELLVIDTCEIMNIKDVVG